mmetsp:Transcript_36266/g.88587  ORF Transcript_36266/g.88587 Transcript_36266/m.88587 type:complete len:312 (+) Transcript_36266:82-1017(+)|eukprot:CAMPEP_0198326858 /NCGR_PEP_ID=MMETSP1450-20131203/14275_1 /TAXON_ID=753684 ORGANISM="Madagascaria erythrocladiodes, Strain CCMP3234" /NCGR_SAMPLE_ID=MMETSP1450 /ASSEMBLY_ACC=CAM_ASM_001115 /LENGTH=311 /DNA_ID=CAMNT_0044030861 /DNA_START=63 /DNA_END=998 /DNA_ORIENTATION=+
MASRIAVPFLVANMGCEMVFVIEHRLRELPETSVPQKKRDEILDDIIRAVFNDALMENIFAEQKLYAIDTFRKLLFAMAQSPSMRISQENFDKMFRIMSMSIKAQVMRWEKPEDLLSFTERHLDAVEALIIKKIGAGEAIGLVEFVRKSAQEFYGDLSIGEYLRLRASLLNFFRELRAPVANLIQEGYQAPNGLVLVSTSGPNADHLGEATVYGPNDDEILDVYSLAIAGRGLEERELPLGDNLFAADRQPAGDNYSIAGSRRLDTVPDVPDIRSSVGSLRIMKPGPEAGQSTDEILDELLSPKPDDRGMR